ncbi:MAG: hypothetical protein OEM59_02180 [Rhodospirillales bacterium]|nr:hypothetical protein [Rhodospirillales bacterium]
MHRVKEWKKHELGKAPAHWENSNLSSLDLRQLNAYSTDVASDRPIFSSKLESRAITACDRQRRSKNLNCECVLIGVNGKSVLDVPTSFVASASVDRAVKCRLPDGDVLITGMSPCRVMGGKVIAE